MNVDKIEQEIQKKIEHFTMVCRFQEKTNREMLVDGDRMTIPRYPAPGRTGRLPTRSPQG
jgi:hypothetical protein